ncbi:MAG: phosphatase PAP2 family protein [Candidatus Zixiibacteriota bacterium]|nr:MAG: phosphatase PAP2 family protein [candidate division Zixibacteria bacterium]
MSSGVALNDSYRSRLRPIDIATLAYVLIEISVILVFMSGKPGWLYMLFFYMSAVCIVLLMIAFPFDEFSRPGRMIRIVYPVVLIVFFYRALGAQLFMVFDKPLDYIIHQTELNIFGIDPAFAVQKYIDIWLNEFMSFGYSFFYLFFLSAIILLLLLRKWSCLEKMILSSAIAYYLCFLISIFFPVAGPRFYLDDIYYLPIIGPFFTPIAKIIVNSGGHYGASMPSSQCAVAFIVAWRLGSDVKKLRIPAIFIVLLICMSTVYGRFHYLTESLTGVIIGILGLWISNRWQDRFMKQRENGSAANHGR